MRVVCLHPAREPAFHDGGTLSIGSAADNDVVAPGSDARHATITSDRRGLVLDVHVGCQRVYVNARAVRERALLRLGDALTIGAQKFMITADAEPEQADAGGTVATPTRSPFALRVLTGTASGQSLAIAPDLRLGAGSRHFGELAYSCRIACAPEGLLFRSESASPRVNGWHCKSARLHAGDQITLGEHRLVVDAPGLEYAERVAAMPPPAPPPKVVAPSIPHGDSAHAEVWWLLAAAVLLAGLIALLLYFRW